MWLALVFCLLMRGRHGRPQREGARVGASTLPRHFLSLPPTYENLCRHPWREGGRHGVVSYLRSHMRIPADVVRLPDGDPPQTSVGKQDVLCRF